MKLSESSFGNLYDSILKAFPKTRFRQHAVQPIVIEHMGWLPFIGLKTLFVKGEIRNETRHYNTLILFKNVDYNGKQVKITANDGLQYEFNKLSLEHSQILVRCQCDDFRYRFSYYNSLDKSLYGNKFKKYESKGMRSPANPLELPGICKHIIRTFDALRDAEIFVD